MELKVYMCTSFDGHFPVGVAAVVVAENPEDAAGILSSQLHEDGLTQEIYPDQMEELLMEKHAFILANGDY